MNAWRRHIPRLATLAVLLAAFATASTLYSGFFSLRVIVNLLADNAFLGIIAFGLTFVIISGGIDLSVGAVAALSTVLVALLIRAGWPPIAAIAFALACGSVIGAVQGWLVEACALPPFLVTLAGMFLARGLAFWLTAESLPIEHAFYRQAADCGIPLNSKLALPLTALLLLATLAAGSLIARGTRFGRNIYALGGNAASALMMGVPVARTRIAVYAICGFCAALGGVTATFYMGSANPALGSGLELDAIAAVVIGGTLLTGGVGTLSGTFLGLMIFGTIRSALDFDGRLNSWWLRIVIGALLLSFVLLQRLLARQPTGRTAL